MARNGPLGHAGGRRVARHLPVLGGVVFTLLVGLWSTSSLWFFTTFGVVFSNAGEAT